MILGAVLRFPAVLQQALGAVLYRLRERVHRPKHFRQGGQMLAELYGEVPEDEPAGVATIPGVPNVSQRECTGRSAEIGRW